MTAVAREESSTDVTRIGQTVNDIVPHLYISPLVWQHRFQ